MTGHNTIQLTEIVCGDGADFVVRLPATAPRQFAALSGQDLCSKVLTVLRDHYRRFAELQLDELRLFLTKSSTRPGWLTKTKDSVNAITAGEVDWEACTRIEFTESLSELFESGFT